MVRLGFCRARLRARFIYRFTLDRTNVANPPALDDQMHFTERADLAERVFDVLDIARTQQTRGGRAPIENAGRWIFQSRTRFPFRKTEISPRVFSPLTGLILLSLFSHRASMVGDGLSEHEQNSRDVNHIRVHRSGNQRKCAPLVWHPNSITTQTRRQATMPSRTFRFD